MTALTYVSQKEMEKRTGFGKALGYAFPEEDEILIRKGLPKKLERKVKKHEEEHISKGESGPFLPLLLGSIATLGGAALSAKGAKRGGEIAAAGSDKEIAFNRESRDLVRADQAPYRKAGATALSALMDMTGLSGMGGGGAAAAAGGSAPYVAPSSATPQRVRNMDGRRSSYRAYGGPTERGTVYNVHEMGPENIYRDGSYTRGRGPATIDGATGYVEPHVEARYEGGPIGAYDDRTRPLSPPNTANSTAINPSTGFPEENPGGREGGYSFKTDPGYQFRFEEGQRAIDRSASASGHSLSGGAVRKAIRYGEGMASAEYGNVFNRIGLIAGIGQTATNASGAATMGAGGRMGTAASTGANASAYGAIGAGNAWANAGNQIAQMPWGDVFNRDKPPPGVPA